MTRKASDGIVHPRTILDCVLQIQHHGTTRAKQRLEAIEPDLAEYLLETLTAIYHDLLNLHGSSAKTRKVYHQIEVMALVCIEALRRSNAELWQQQIDNPAGDGESDQLEEKPDG